MNNTYKVLWVDVLSELGGAQFSMFETCAKLKENGVTVETALPPGPLSDRFRNAGFTVYPISPIRASKRGFSFFTTAARLLRSPHTISQIVRVCDPDIVHANSLAAFITTAHVPKSIATIWHVRDAQKDPLLIRNSVRRANAIITASETIDTALTDMVSRRYRGKLHLIRNGIDPGIFTEKRDRAQLRSELGLPAEGPLIGMVAHIVPWKKHDVFIESAALIRKSRPDAQFVIIGNDLFNENKRYEKQLKALVNERELQECFHWLKNSSSPEKFIPALDMLIHPPRHEPFGRIVCEAMLCGIPVLTADTGGPAAIVTHHQTGWLVENGTAKNFAETAIDLLNNPGQCKSITAKARRHILENYTTDRVCRDLMHLYSDVLRRLYEDLNYTPDKD
ncbi:MAG: glycosyltransferase family 4 protein [Kiritimatiellia bacterium]